MTNFSIMPRKIIAAIAGISVLIFGFLYFIAGDFRVFWRSTLSAQQIKAERLACSASLSSRAGYCTFQLNQQEFDSLVQKLQLSKPKSTGKMTFRDAKGAVSSDMPPWVQDFGCVQKGFDYISGSNVEAYVKEGGSIRDDRKNVEFHAIFYDRTSQKSCVQLHYPYG